MDFSIDHLGIAVKSLAAAKSIYEKLGLSCLAGGDRRAGKSSARDGSGGREPAGTSRSNVRRLDHCKVHCQARRGAAPRVLESARPACARSNALREMACGWFRKKSRPGPGGISTFLSIRQALAGCCWSWCSHKTPAANGTILSDKSHSMLLLVTDTSGRNGSVALARDVPAVKLK